MPVGHDDKLPAGRPRKKRATSNVLFILVDDLGYHDLSCTGSAYYETLNIDRIAAEGRFFTNSYASCQVCSPSRASIMSGKFPSTAWHHGQDRSAHGRPMAKGRKAGRFSKLLPPDYKRELPRAYTVLPEAMKEAGYKTFFAGKWHLGGKGSLPEDHGFDVNIGGYQIS